MGGKSFGYFSPKTFRAGLKDDLLRPPLQAKAVETPSGSDGPLFALFDGKIYDFLGDSNGAKWSQIHGI